jgi:hypothetical protein
MLYKLACKSLYEIASRVMFVKSNLVELELLYFIFILLSFT